MKSNQVTLTFQLNMSLLANRLLKVLVAAELTILFLDIFANHHQWLNSRPMQRFFNITREDSFPNWFSSSQAILVGVVLLLIWHTQRQNKPLSPLFNGWAASAGIFIFIGFDDATKLHERLGSVFNDQFVDHQGFAGSLLEWFPSYTWQLVVLPVFVLMGIYMLYFFYYNISRQGSRRLIIIAFCGFGTAVGLDFIEGIDTVFDAMSAHLNYDQSHLLHYWKAVEEIIEMFSTTLFLIAFLKELDQRLPKAIQQSEDGH